jgi:hypothetical protein
MTSCEAFDHLARFFENSAAELTRRNPGIEVRLRRIDADRFTCAAYRSGTPASACTVAFGGRRAIGARITFLANDSRVTNSFNEALSVGADEQLLYLKPLGMQAVSGGPRAGAKLTLEGGAKFLVDALHGAVAANGQVKTSRERISRYERLI